MAFIGHRNRDLPSLLWRCSTSSQLRQQWGFDPRHAWSTTSSSVSGIGDSSINPLMLGPDDVAYRPCRNSPDNNGGSQEAAGPWDINRPMRGGEAPQQMFGNSSNNRHWTSTCADKQQLQWPSPRSFSTLPHELQHNASLGPSSSRSQPAKETPTLLPPAAGSSHQLIAPFGSSSSPPRPEDQQTSPPGGPQPSPIRPPTWADKHCPPSVLPFVKLMRADAPIGTYLLLLPCTWSIALAADAGSLPDMHNMALFSIGAFLLRSAGCTINDLWDRELDAKVERTKHRPLASGALSPQAAVGALAGQLLLGLGVLIQMNDYSKVLGASSLLLVGTYPLMKRVTYWPQAYLGLAINWGALLGYAAVQGHCDWPIVLPLYAGGVFWTLVYDTIYAHQDKDDDVSAGVKSTALLFGDDTKKWLAAFASLSTGSFVACGMAAGAGPAFYMGVGGVAAHYAWQIRAVDLDSRPDCWEKFNSNKWLGAMLTGGIALDRLMLF